MSDTSSTSGEPNGQTAGDGSSTEGGTAAPTVEDLQAQIEDLKKHSRKWEDRAKENYEARKELDTLRESQMSEDQKRAKALDKAEQRAAAAEAALLRYKVASEFGIDSEDVELFLTASDEDTLRKQAQRLSATRSSGPRPNAAQGKRGGSGPVTPADAFGDFLDANF